MYVLFFLLLAGFAYGGLLIHLRGNVNIGVTIFTVFAVICTVVLMLVPMGEEIVFASSSTETGSAAGETTNLASTDEWVLLSRASDLDYQVWLWFHVALLITHAMLFFANMMRTES